MGESFKKLKRKNLISAIIKSAVVGLSAGLFVAGVLLLALQLGSVDFHWAFYILIGVAAAALAGGLLFKFIFPTDIKVARKYDAELGLNEKLQTMVEFSGAEGDIVDLQRQDALEKLSNAPAPKLKFSRIWYYIVIAVVALAIFFSGIFIPPAVRSDDPPYTPGEGELPPDGENPGETEPVFEYDLYMQADMASLIGEIRDSALDDTVRLFMVAELEALDEQLKEITLQSEMKAAVFAAVSDIDQLIENTNSFRKLSEELIELDINLSSAIVKGFISYKSRLVKTMPLTYVQSLRTGMGDYIEAAMEDFMTASYEAIKVSQMPSEGEKGLGEVLEEYYSGLDGVLTVSGIDATDALYDCLKIMSTGLKSIKRQVDNSGTSDSVLHERISDNYGIMTKSIVSALSVQTFKAIMEAYLRQELASILNISFTGLTELYDDLVYTDGNETPPGGDPGDGEEEPGNSSGGFGEGNKIYGSDDLIYYPKTGTMEKFGDVYKDYKDALEAGTLDEDFPEYLQIYLKNYLDYLEQGVKDPDDDEN